MPNWCFNTLDIIGDKETLKEIMSKANGASPWLCDDEKKNEEDEFQFHNFVPVPDEVLAGGYNGENRSDVEIAHGVLSGYEWEHEYWGCKWGACNTSIDYDEGANEIYITFDSAWAPPIEFYENFSMRYPDLTLNFEYSEPGMAFAGEGYATGGSIISHDIWEIQYNEEEEYDEEVEGTRRSEL